MGRQVLWDGIGVGRVGGWAVVGGGFVGVQPSHGGGGAADSETFLVS